MRPAIFFTDVHISKLTPKSARESCWQTVSTALSWVADLAVELNAEVILCGGDITDKYNWPSFDSYQLWRLFNKFPSPVYTVVGNHDIPGANLSLLSFSGLGQIINPNFDMWGASLNIGPGGVKIIDTVQQFGPFRVVGYQWNDPLLEEVPLNYTRIEEKFNKIPLEKGEHVNILVSHATVGPNKTDYCPDYTQLEIDSRIDFALFGDIHTGFGPVKLKNGVTAGNPGALYRRSFAEKDNIPGVFIIWPDKKIEWREIPHVKPEEAFYVKSHERRANLRDMDFKAAIAASRAAKNMNPIDFVRQVGQEAGFREEPIEQVIKRIQKNERKD